MKGTVLALSGGVGGAKLAHGLARVLESGQLTVVVNTGDDFRHLGLWISPDIDSVVYALAGMSDSDRGWGRRDETWTFMRALKQLGGHAWFSLGDGDLAMHVHRTFRLGKGESLTSVTEQICSALAVKGRVLPMSDDPVSTQLLAAEGWLDFQEYFVHRHCQPTVQQIAFAGATTARAQPEVLATLNSPSLRAVIICPSNPFVSVDPILAVPGMREALRKCTAPVIAVTPIVGGKAIKGPAAKMMLELGLEVTAEAVARRYAEFIDAFVTDESDGPSGPIPGVLLVQAPTIMAQIEDRERLARIVLEIADQLSGKSVNE